MMKFHVVSTPMNLRELMYHKFREIITCLNVQKFMDESKRNDKSFTRFNFLFNNFFSSFLDFLIAVKKVFFYYLFVYLLIFCSIKVFLQSSCC